MNKQINVVIFAKKDMEIKRLLKEKIVAKLFKNKAIIVIGARQIGKTTLLNQLMSSYDNTLFLDADDRVTRELLQNPSTEELKNIIGNHKMVFIDEVQRIETIGITSKIIVDQFKDVQLLLSGSSAFDVKNKISESLTGRKWEFAMFPISWKELEDTVCYVKSMQQLDLRLIYGMYPEIITHPSEEIERLKQLVDSYLYKDLLAFSSIKKPDVLEKLLKALAFQMGSEVSFNELAQLLNVDKNTVASYIQILEKGYVIFSLNSYSKNLRNELKFAKKIYFWDNGVRNAIINNFNLMEMRNDKGELWENFIISERMKKNTYLNFGIESYFWRTRTQQEIDYIEVENGYLTAFEIKINENAKIKKFEKFTEAYQTEVKLIHKKNFRDLLV